MDRAESTRSEEKYENSDRIFSCYAWIKYINSQNAGFYLSRVEIELGLEQGLGFSRTQSLGIF